MNKIIVLATLTMAAMASQAQDLGRVLSATPITQQVAVPQQVCGNETIYNGARPTTGGGAVLGAIAGGAAGNAIGSGGGRAAATALGVIGGALLGNQIESGRPGYQNVQRCTTETYYDHRVIGYDVAYEYAGRSYTTRTQSDPGQWIPITVQPAVPGMSGYTPPGYAAQNAGDPGYGHPGAVYGTPPGPPAYVVPPPAVYEHRYPYYGHYPYRQRRYNY